MESYKDFLSIYHTSIRNIASYTSISMGALAYSRFYRGKQPLYNVGTVFVSISMLIVSILINYNLIEDIKQISLTKLNQSEKERFRKWFLIPHITFGFLSLLLLFAVFTFVREFYDKVL